MRQKRKRRRLHNKIRRRREILRRRTLLCKVVAGVVLAGVLLFLSGNLVRSMRSKTIQSAAAAETVTGKKALLWDETIDEFKPSADELEASADQDAGVMNSQEAEEIPDRSSYAVAPGVPAGSQSSPDDKVVYLTFDDGPSQNTGVILDILDRYKVKATFFVVGMNPQMYGQIKKAYDKGHTIGLHTFSHDYAEVYSSREAYFQDLERIGKVVLEQIGYIPCFIRFPGGSSNQISANYSPGIMTALAQEVQERGYQYYDWNVSSGDGGVHTADEIVGYATSSDYPHIILLMHDAVNKETTAEALPRVIEHYQKKGYRFEALDRETFCAHHGIGN